MTAPIMMTSAEAYRLAIASQPNVAAPPSDREALPAGGDAWTRAINATAEVDPNAQMLAERVEAARGWMEHARQAKVGSTIDVPGGFSKP